MTITLEGSQNPDVGKCRLFMTLASASVTAASACDGTQVQSPATDDEIEDTLNFQLEELSKMADDELSLIPQMAEWKPWDVSAGMYLYDFAGFGRNACLPSSR